MNLKTFFIVVLTIFAIFVFVFKIFGCEILCLARTDLQADSLWETNDIVLIKDNKANWGSSERDLSLFYIIKIPTVSKSTLDAYVVKITSGTGISLKIVRNSKYKIDTTKFIVNSNVILTQAQFLSAIIVKP